MKRGERENQEESRGTGHLSSHTASVNDLLQVWCYHEMSKSVIA